MIRAIVLCVLSALAGAGIAIQMMSTSVAVADACRVYGYTHCRVIGTSEVPETSDPRARRELTKFVRQVSRDKL